ncbi:hypothetical protein ACFP2T_26995 [Plantactinospora solaniradicis]|uniref:Secreted protein n=1 Tax=Plantactinospora solaniradicis TaxID=1723736 RepID=A0ABW1KFY7_9ACTN
MRTPRRGLLTLAAMAGVAVALLTPTAASAAYAGSETDYAAASNGPTNGYVCIGHTGVTACFKPLDDLIYVKDTEADGYAAVVEWSADAPWDNYRSGSCVNKLGAGNWGVCNKNFVEDGNISINGARYNNGNLVDDGDWITLTT